VPNLFDVLALQFPNPADRWTYHYTKNEQIDYVLVSKPLRNALSSAGVERRGIFEVDKFTAGGTKSWPSVDSHRNAASDHGALWADFNI
jgi:endonuclease/exonuclease/phosphatase family metal-dependent hydrolase